MYKSGLESGFIINSSETISDEANAITFSYELELPEGWFIEVNGSLVKENFKSSAFVIKSANGKEGFMFNPVIVYDNHYNKDEIMRNVIFPLANSNDLKDDELKTGDKNKTYCEYSVVFVDGKIKISFSLETNWLKDEGRQYPVYIDPTIEILTAYGQSSQNNSGMPYNTYYHDQRYEFIVLASDLTAVGIPSSASITGIGMYCSENSGQAISNFRILTCPTTATTKSGWRTSGWTTNYGPSGITTPVNGTWYDYTFGTIYPFTSSNNIEFSISRDNSAYVSGGGNYCRNISSRAGYGYSDSGYTWPYDGMSYTAFDYLPSMRITYSTPCTQPSPYGTANAPTDGTLVTISSCNWAGEYATINNIVSGETYNFTSSVATDWFVLTDASNNILTQGTNPLTWTATFSGSVRLHISTNSSCGTQSTCRTTTVQCLSCLSLCNGGVLAGSINPTPFWQTVSTNTYRYYTFTAGFPGELFIFSFCQGGGSTSIDTQLEVNYNSSGWSTGFSNDDYCGFGSEVVFIAPAAGTYRINIYQFDCLTSSVYAGVRAYRRFPVPTTADCLGALPLCNVSNSHSVSAIGGGNYYDLYNFQAQQGMSSSTYNCPNCLITGELNSMWYTFTVQVSGLLGFTIQPNASADYDWSLHNMSTLNCSDLVNYSVNPPISCNFSEGFGATGMSIAGVSSCVPGYDAAQFNSRISVNAGETYALHITNYNGNTAGYTIDFSNSTSSIVDNTGPSMNSIVYPPFCGSSSIVVQMSEGIACTSVDASSFVLTGPSGTYAISDVWSSLCESGSASGTYSGTWYDDIWTIDLADYISNPGSYTLSLVNGTLDDVCGHGAVGNSLNFSITGISATLNVLQQCGCPGQNQGQLSITGVSGGTAPYSYSWTGPSGYTSTSSSISNLAPGTYSITVTDYVGRCEWIDDVTLTEYTLATAPTTISGTTTICNGSSTSLTASGGTTGDGSNIYWFTGSCGLAYANEWYTQPFGTGSTILNSVNGILDVTSTTNDPMIYMSGLGSFDPNVYRYINIRYRVVSGTAGATEIFFYNTSHNWAVGGESVSGALISDGTWRILTIDMGSDPDYFTGGNILGWRFDWCTASGVRMEIDYISLSSGPGIGSSATISLSPTSSTTYYAARGGGCNTTGCASTTVTVDVKRHLMWVMQILVAINIKNLQQFTG